MKPLTAKQRQFCLEYLADLNATAAVIRCGYAASVAKQTAAKLMANPRVQAEIQKQRKDREKRTKVTVDAVVKELEGIAFAKVDPQEEEGPPPAVTTGHKISALDKLMRHLGGYNDKLEVETTSNLKGRVDAAIKKIKNQDEASS
ncbi:MAG: hypothetical protein RL095_1747 [Verrucomicrobiota bacterium]|jgi:phage terminase small subunit